MDRGDRPSGCARPPGLDRQRARRAIRLRPARTSYGRTITEAIGLYGTDELRLLARHYDKMSAVYAAQLWCGPLDHNPANVMRAADGRLVVADLFYADGPSLYATAATDPDLIVARIPQAQRRFMTEIPLAVSGPWEPGAQEAIRVGLAAADARKATA